MEHAKEGAGAEAGRGLVGGGGGGGVEEVVEVAFEGFEGGLFGRSKGGVDFGFGGWWWCLWLRCWDDCGWVRHREGGIDLCNQTSGTERSK